MAYYELTNSYGGSAHVSYNGVMGADGVGLRSMLQGRLSWQFDLRYHKRRDARLFHLILGPLNTRRPPPL